MVVLQKGTEGFTKAQECFSCHQTGLPARAFAPARERGLPVNEPAARMAQIVQSNMTSMDYGDARMVNLLLKAGADPQVRTKTGETALTQSKKYQYSHIEAALQKAGARE